MALQSTFLYFGFGSNLLAERIRMNNPTAVRKGIGKLMDYRLDFGFFAKQWNGSVATVVPDNGCHVWGAIWELNENDIPNLDRQEGVADGIYKVIHVDIEISDRKKLNCRCYQLCNLPKKIPKGYPLPDDRKPSLLYMSVILRGAVESCLPEEYISKLRNIQHNGWNDSNIEKIMIIDN